MLFRLFLGNGSRNIGKRTILRNRFFQKFSLCTQKHITHATFARFQAFFARFDTANNSPRPPNFKKISKNVKHPARFWTAPAPWRFVAF